MKNKTSNIIRADYAVMVAYGILTVLYYGLTDLLRAEFNISTSPIMLAVYALILYKIVMTEYERKELLIGAGLLAVGLISLVYLKDTTILTNVLVLFSLKDMDLKKVFRAVFWSALVCYFVVILCSLVEIGLPISMTLDFRGTGEVTRYCFGYSHPNSLQLYTIRILCLYVAAYFEKIDWKHICVFAVVNYIAYFFSDSRTGFICGCILVGLLLFYKYMSRIVEHKIWKSLVVIGLIFVVFFGIWSVVYFDEVDILKTINSFFTGRIYLANIAYRDIGFTWWGSTEIEKYIVDNGIMRMLLGYGGIPFFIYWSSMFVTLIRALNDKKYDVVILFFVFTVYAIMEGTVLLKIFRNIPMVYMAAIAWGKLVNFDIKEKRLHC